MLLLFESRARSPSPNCLIAAYAKEAGVRTPQAVGADLLRAYLLYRRETPTTGAGGTRGGCS